MKIGKLTFKELDVEGRASISTDLSDEDARGIYAYEFSDGTWYVGKSVDVRDRHVQHMHEYRHMDPPLHATKMLWASVTGDGQELDYAESGTIAWFETKGYDLRNKAKTGRPGGSLEVMVDTGNGWGVSIPWDRDRIPASTREFTFEEQPKMLEKFKKLQSIPEYDSLIATLAWYVHNTIPAPADTAGSLWVVTAMPSTYGRLCCITCQNVETFVVFEDGAFDKKGPWAFVNLKPAEDMLVPDWGKGDLGNYENLRNCIRFTFDSLDEVDYMLASERMLDCCYRVNSELMRKGASMMKRYNNPYLVDAILNYNLPEREEVQADEHVLRISKKILDPLKTPEFVPFEPDVAPGVFWDIIDSGCLEKEPTMADRIVQTAGREALGQFAPDFAHFNDDVLFGENWNNQDIDLKTRCIITVVALMAQGITDNSLKYHLENAKVHGVSQKEMAAVITHVAFYAGWPKAWAVFNLAKEVYRE